MPEQYGADEERRRPMTESTSPRNSRKVADMATELNKVKGSVTVLTVSDNQPKDSLLKELKEELNKATTGEKNAISLLSESHKRIQTLELELRKSKETESKMLDSFVSQTKQLEQTKISLEESKLEIATLRDKLNDLNNAGPTSKRVEITSLEAELVSAKENVFRVKEMEKLSSMNANHLLEEMSLIKNELKLSTVAEENNKKAMDDLALALKEVCLENTQVKENLNLTRAELDSIKTETNNLKSKLVTKEEELIELRKTADQYKNTTSRLRSEAEESLNAWNGKEAVFVGCIKRAEEERDAELEENKRLLESLENAENVCQKAKEENTKVRDILKHAVNEANVAKEAAGIARVENSRLNVALAEKERDLDFLYRENENLKTNETLAFDNIKELKRIIYETTTTPSTPSIVDVKTVDAKTADKKHQGRKLTNQNSFNKDSNNDKNLVKTTSFKLKDVKVSSNNKLEADEIKQHQNESSSRGNNEDFDENGDPLKGSIFDVSDSPDTPAVLSHHRKRSSITFTLDAEMLNVVDEYDHIDGGRYDETEGDRSSGKKKALLRRFGDLMKRKNVSRRESLEPKPE